MTDEDTRLMEKFGITSEAKTVFHFRSHRYDRLQDALNYAQKTQDQSPELDAVETK